MCLFAPSEQYNEGGNSIYLGKSLIYKVPVMLDLGMLINPHMTVVGMSGSGKSYMLRSLIIREHEQAGARVFVIDWNGEYKSTIEFLGGRSYILGSEYRIGIKSLKNESRMLDCIASAAAHTLKIEDSAIGEVRHYVSEILEVRESSGAGGRSTLKPGGTEYTSLSEAVRGRLDALRIGSFFSEGGFRLEESLEGVTSIDLSNAENDVQREFVVHAVLQMLIEYMHGLSIGNPGMLLIVLDEAWRSAGDIQLIQRLYREGRKYGVGIITATQQISDLDSGVLSNSACTFIFRLQGDERLNRLVELGFIKRRDVQNLSDAGVGRCLLRSTYRGGAAASFFIDKIDGFEINMFCINDGRMRIEIPMERISEAAERLGMDANAREGIRAFIENGERKLDIVELARYMISKGFDRPTIVAFMRLLGIEDIAIIRAYENAKDYRISLE